MTSITAETSVDAHCARCKAPRPVPTEGERIIRTEATVTADTADPCPRCTHTRVVINIGVTTAT